MLANCALLPTVVAPAKGVCGWRAFGDMNTAGGRHRMKKPIGGTSSIIGAAAILCPDCCRFLRLFQDRRHSNDHSQCALHC
jgi:hypothetical protein